MNTKSGGLSDCSFANRSNEASQEAVVGSAQRVVVARARAPRDAAVQHRLEYLPRLLASGF